MVSTTTSIMLGDSVLCPQRTPVLSVSCPDKPELEPRLLVWAVNNIWEATPPPYGTDAGVFTLYVALNQAYEIVAYVPNFPPTSHPQPLIDTDVVMLRRLRVTDNTKLYLYGPWSSAELVNIMPNDGILFYVRINGNYSNTIDIYKRLGAIE